jgi:hypothetical protein
VLEGGITYSSSCGCQREQVHQPASSSRAARGVGNCNNDNEHEKTMTTRNAIREDSRAGIEKPVGEKRCNLEKECETPIGSNMWHQVLQLTHGMTGTSLTPGMSTLTSTPRPAASARARMREPLGTT